MIVKLIYSIEESFFDSEADWGYTHKLTVIRSVTSGYLYELYDEYQQNGDKEQKTYRIAPISCPAIANPKPSSSYTADDVEVEIKTGNKDEVEDIDLSKYEMQCYPYNNFIGKGMIVPDRGRALTDDEYRVACDFFNNNKSSSKRKNNDLEIEYK